MHRNVDGATGTRSGMGFVAETGSGHVLTMDGAPDDKRPEIGGANLARVPWKPCWRGRRLQRLRCGDDS